MKHALSTLFRVLLIGIGAAILLRHGASEGMASVILVGGCVALIVVPAYHLLPRDFTQARDEAITTYRKVRGK